MFSIFGIQRQFVSQYAKLEAQFGITQKYILPLFDVIIKTHYMAAINSTQVGLHKFI